MAKDIWVNNFSIETGTYHLLMTTLDHSIPIGIKTFFSKEIKEDDYEYFSVFEGLTNTGTYFTEELLNKMIKGSMNLILEKAEKVEEIHEKTYKTNDQYFETAKKCVKKNISILTDKQLGELHKELTLIQVSAHGMSLPTSWFLDSEGETFSKYLLAKTKKIVELSWKKHDPARVFSILTTKADNSLGINEEIESLKLLGKIANNKTAKELITNLDNFSEIPENMPHDIKEEIQKHYQKWRWMPFTYLGPAYYIDYYLQHWNSLLNSNINIDEEIRRLENRPANVKREKEKLAKELGINSKDMKTYDIAADIAFLKGYRKDIMHHGFYALSFILAEMAKRLKVPLNDMHLISYRELENYFINGVKINLHHLKSRKKKVVYVYKQGRGQLLIEDEAEQYLKDKEFRKESIDLNLSQLKGTTACSGTAKGAVKIINKPEEMSKMQQGDIMVSHTTFPALVPAMKKAAAILTEDGGITCHAAIVSRELKTQCITGIKTLTKVLKDGDIVEVDASNGIVKIEKNSQNTKENAQIDFSKEEFVRHKRDYSLVATSLVQETYFSKEFIDYFGFDMKPVFITYKNKEFAHYFAHSDEIKRAKEWVKKNTIEDLKKQRAHFDKENEDYRRMLKVSHADPIKAVKKLHKYFKDFLPFLWGCLDVYEFENKNISKEMLEIMKQTRAKYEDFYKVGLVLEKELFKQIEKDKGIEPNTLHWLTMSEFRKFLESGKHPDVSKRRESFYCIRTRLDSEDFIPENELNKYPFLKSNNVGNISEIKGKPAYSGKYKGYVRKISQIEQIKNVQDGDIIVAGMTDPRYMPILNKVGAIVTDEGGITCHAAIVSREMKIPCIIGTQVATDVLKDGDYVEVDAINGVINKLSSAGSAMDEEWERVATRGKKQSNLLLDMLAVSFNLGLHAKALNIQLNPSQFRQFDNSRWMLKSEIDEMVQQIKEQEEKCPGSLKKYADYILTNAEKTREIADKYKKVDFRPYSTKEIMHVLKEAFDIGIKMCGGIYGYVFINRFYPDKIIEIISKKTNDKKKLDECIKTIFTIDKNTNIRQEKKDLLIIAKKASQLGINSREIKEMIQEHVKKYAFLSIQYFIGSPLTEQVIAERIKELLNTDIDAKLEEINSLEKNSQKTSEIIEQLNLSDEEAGMIEAIKLLLLVPQEWDESVNYYVYNLENLWREIVRRLGTTREGFAEMTIGEVYKGLEQGLTEAQKQDIAVRVDDSILLYKDNEVKVLTGEEFNEYKERNLPKEKDLSYIKELKGQSACSGKVRGKAKLVLVNEDISKVEKGDILVAASTTPAFVPAMEKAGAIITNEGGLLSHAAIVSRELNVPCVIGTKIGTKAIRDGDFIEVDADTGIIKKL